MVRPPPRTHQSFHHLRCLRGLPVRTLHRPVEEHPAGLRRIGHPIAARDPDHKEGITVAEMVQGDGRLGRETDGLLEIEGGIRHEDMDEIIEIGIVNVIIVTGIGNGNVSEIGKGMVVAVAMAEVTGAKGEDLCGMGDHGRGPEVVERDR